MDTTLTGTVMTNRKDMPLAVKEKRKRQKGECKTYKKGLLVVNEWTDKRTLATLSTKHSNRMVDVTNRYSIANVQHKQYSMYNLNIIYYL